MQTPFYLRLRSLNALAIALRKADTKVLSVMIHNFRPDESNDPCTQRLVQKELLRRRMAFPAV